MKQTIKLILCAVFVTSLLFSCASTNAKKTNPTGLKVQNRTEIVSVTGGDLRGILNKEGNVEIFAGIPFAAPPVGDLRWKEPQDVIPWTGVRDADCFAPMAMQNENGRFFQTLMNIYTGSKNDRTYKGPMSEDCLYLNVWRPVGKAPQGGWPVLVYVHGGTLLTGQSWYEKYDGENLAANGIVKGAPYNIRTKKYDGLVLSSIKSDQVILKAINKILSVVFLTNQFLVEGAEYNKYME